MTTRRAGRRSASRAARRPMAWFNNGSDMQTLAGSTSITFPLLPPGTLPAGYSSGMTVLRLIVRVTSAAVNVLEVVNAIYAFYVTIRPGIVEVPNLNADLLDYYLLGQIEIPSTPVGTIPTVQSFDIRTARRLRGDRDLLFRITNLETTPMQIGMSMRVLLTPS